MKKAFLSTRPFSIDLGLLLLRLFAGGALLTHGYPKFQKILNGNFQFGDPLGIGPEVSLILTVFAELFCSVLLILGLTTRLALIPLIITMAVAFFIVHGADDFSTKELGFLYLGIFVSLFFTGPGKFSADRAIFR
jgi:putative oxidoreductase